jgi:hypothetical protein
MNEKKQNKQNKQKTKIAGGVVVRTMKTVKGEKGAPK